MPSSPPDVPQRLRARDDFLERYRIKRAEYNQTGLIWPDLATIYGDYRSWYQRLHPLADQIAASLKFAPKVHASGCRVKDPEHLIEKIIRNSFVNERPSVTPENYRRIIRDFIGARALHLFKEDWPDVHRYIKHEWNRQLVRNPPPEAHVTADDPDHIRKLYSRARCEVSLNNQGYRSVHYTLRLPFGGRSVLAEIQVRTMFEEAYGEISHKLVYPYKQNEELLKPVSEAVSYAAGTADAWASILSCFSRWIDLPAPNSPTARLMRDELAKEIQLKAAYGIKMKDAFKDKVRLNRQAADPTGAVVSDILGIDRSTSP